MPCGAGGEFWRSGLVDGVGQGRGEGMMHLDVADEGRAKDARHGFLEECQRRHISALSGVFAPQVCLIHPERALGERNIMDDDDSWTHGSGLAADEWQKCKKLPS